MKVGAYARVSTATRLERQNPDTQLLPLREFCKNRGWEIVEEFVDDVSAIKHRPQYDQMLRDARAGKFRVIVVIRLDRLFRSMEEFVRVVRDLNDWGARLVCVDQNIDTDKSSPAGKLLMHIIASVSEFERSLISERVRAGISRVRAEGKPWGGRVRKQIDANEARDLRAKGYSLTKIGALLGCNRNIVARELAVATSTPRTRWDAPR